MSAETVIRLSEIDNIIGLKEANGDMDHVRKIVTSTKPGFLIYSGNDDDTIPVLAHGGHGVISVASHLVGTKIQAMLTDHEHGRQRDALLMDQRLRGLFQGLFKVSNPIIIKYILNELGFNVGNPRMPLLHLHDAVPEDQALIREVDHLVENYRSDFDTWLKNL